MKVLNFFFAIAVLTFALSTPMMFGISEKLYVVVVGASVLYVLGSWEWCRNKF